MLEFKDLPEEIQERMLDEQVRQGNEKSEEVFEVDITSARPDGGFTWSYSLEGHDFWNEIIIKGNFEAFYEKYPKTSDKLYSEEEVRKLFIKHCKDLWRVRQRHI